MGKGGAGPARASVAGTFFYFLFFFIDFANTFIRGLVTSDVTLDLFSLFFLLRI